MNDFKQNYTKLQDIAEKLRSQQEPDIDALIPMVEEATKAYNACKVRIEGVQKALEEQFDK